MKRIFLFTGCLFISQLFFAQNKELPSCVSLKKELREVKRSFANIVEKFKSKEDKVSLIKTYFSDFSICGEKGKIKDYGRNVEFNFSFNDGYYKGGKDEFRTFFEKMVAEANDVFERTHYYKISDEDAGQSCYFYETGKDISSSKKMIRILLSYKDAIDDTEAYSVSVAFEYYPKR
ncbi:MAG TPA: hypothetical protein VFH08_04315 [Chitinophagaceae bacterium]|nr:hypothetical protein [Chitinophagaceae bacterium]